MDKPTSDLAVRLEHLGTALGMVLGVAALLALALCALGGRWPHQLPGDWAVLSLLLMPGWRRVFRGLAPLFHVPPAVGS